MKQVAKYAVGFLLAGLLLWWVLRGHDPAELWANLKRASLPVLLIAVALNLIHVVPRVWRWRALLAPVQASVRFRPMYSAVVIGYMTTWLVPGRLGELVRPALLSGWENVPLGPNLGTIVADRLMDGTTIVALFALATLLDPTAVAAADSQTIRIAALIMVGVVGLAMAALLLFSIWREPIESWLRPRGRLVGGLGRIALSFARGVEALRNPRLLGLVVFHSLLTWLVIALATWIGLRACGVALPFNGVLILLPWLALGVAVPTPGNLGGYQAAMAFGLSKIFGEDPAVAASAGILMHLVVTVPMIAFGLLLLKLEGISWSHLMAVGRQVRALGSAPVDPVPPRPVEEAP